VTLNDDFHTRYITKNHIVGLIVDLFLETPDRYNLINSACLDLFECIQKVLELYLALPIFSHRDIVEHQRSGEGSGAFLPESVKECELRGHISKAASAV
jgi:hypothetical protein